MMDHDSVTLPGLGSFAAEMVPATFSDKGYTINPPYRRLYFIPRQGTDTLLTDLYAASNNISVADATRILVEYLSEMKDVLMAKKLIVLPGLGRLRATRENHFFFIADEDLDIWPSGFGLESISLKTHEETPEEVEAAVSNLAQMLEAEPVKDEMPEQVGHDGKDPGHDEAELEHDDTESGNDETKLVQDDSQDAAPAQKKRMPIFWRVLIWIICIVAIAAIAIAVAGRVAPDWLDYYLYSPEELEILHSL